MDLGEALEDWMQEHEADLLDLYTEEAARFREMHPGIDEREERWNAMTMANRRFIARALGQVLPEWLQTRA
jgi:hypothetical protein